MPVRCDVLREARLDQLPARGVVGVIRWQGPEGVQVIGQDHDRFNSEWPLSLRNAERLAQCIHMGDQGVRATIRQRHRKEKRTAGNPRSSIKNHAPNVARFRAAEPGIQAKNFRISNAHAFAPASSKTTPL